MVIGFSKRSENLLSLTIILISFLTTYFIIKHYNLDSIFLEYITRNNSALTKNHELAIRSSDHALMV
jgi:hypothetical protein